MATFRFLTGAVLSARSWNGAQLLGLSKVCEISSPTPLNSMKCVSMRVSEALDTAQEHRFQMFTANSCPATTHNPVLPHRQEIPQVTIT